MANWFKPRPVLVMVMLFAAPAAALAHLMMTWVPETFAIQRLSSLVQRDAQAFEKRFNELAQVRRETARLRALAEKHGGSLPERWLPQREQHRVSDTLAETLQGDGVTVERLAFDEPALHAAAPGGGVLAREQITVVCRGPYGGLTRRLDRLAELDLPLRLTDVAWKRGARDIEVTLELEIPFAPGAVLEAVLREKAGLDEEDEL